ncbi:hypothetical protein [Alkalihalophilus pseudofirmus]|nr:hypothetical protein [Alkalihalophilus pseudofirmus]
MEHVVREEKASVNREALEMIARLAQGGMRDALSLLDQVLAYALEDVNIDHVIEVTGGVSLNHLFDLVTNVYNRDIQFLIQKVNTLIDLGKDPMLLVDDLTLFYRDLLLLKTIGKEVELNRVILDEKIESFIDTVPIGHLQSLIKQWNEVKAVLKVTSNPKASLEIALVDMTADHPNGLDSSELLALKKEITELRNLVQKDLSSNKVLLQEAKEIKEPEETIEVQPEDDNGTQHDSSEEIEPEIHQLPDVKESNVDFLTQLKEDLANSSVPEYVEVIDAESVEGEVKNNEGNSDSKWIVSLMEIGDKEARSHLNAQREQLEKTVKEARMTAYTILKESEIGLVTAEEVVMIYPTKSKAKVADRVGNSSFIMGAIEDILGKEMNIKNIDRETWNVALSSFKSQTA